MKNIIIIFIIFILTFSTPFKAFAKEESPLASKKYIELPYVKGSYPVLKTIKNKKFEKIVNDKIKETITKKNATYVTSFQKNIELSYEIIQDKNIISILLYFKNIFTEEISICSVNINTNINDFININHILGANGIDYANRVVSSKATNMNILYQKITMDTPFYVKNNNIYVVYGAGQITFPQKGNIIFEVLAQNIINYTLSKDSYYKKSQYNVKMVPLREILEYFGYKTKWNDSNNSITVLKNDDFISYIVIDMNKYSNAVNNFIRQLEFSPEIKDGVTYVPISYFSQILKMLFNVDSNQNIVISAYRV